MELFIIVLLVIALGFSIYGNLNALKKIELYEDFCSLLKSTNKDILLKVARIDGAKAFETDDEVADIYSEIRLQLLRLRNFTGEE